MKRLLSCIAGIFCSLVSLSLFSHTTFILGALVWSLCLALLTYTSNQVGPAFLFGVVLGMEGLGSSHIGVAALLGACTLALHSFFTEQLRFTSLPARFSLANALFLVLYMLLTNGLSPLRAWIMLIGIELLAILGAYAYTELSRAKPISFL